MTDPESSSASSAVRRCVACAEPIPAGATLCKECKSDQARWRNELKFWAGVAGILTLVASGVAFTANLGIQLWQRLFGHEIAITNLDPFGKTVAWNLTKGAIYLRTISITSGAPENRLIWEVHRTIPVNESAEMELREIAHKSWYGLPGTLFGQAPAEYAQVDPALFEQLKRSELTDKYVPTFLMPDSESYTQLKHVLGEKFPTFDCKISVAFTRLWDGSSASIDVPCRGAFRFRSASQS